MTSPEHKRFPILQDESRRSAAEHLAELVLQASRTTDAFSMVGRIPRYSDGRRENVAEHSYMLAIAAPELALTLPGMDLDVDLVRRFALAHDLLEIKTGDVATFDLTQAQLAEKERLEQQALEELCAELPPQTAQDLHQYELQQDPEAIFVRLVDKLLPVAVDITGDGVRVMREDYGVDTTDLLYESHRALHDRIANKFGAQFPELVAVHAVLCKAFEQQFEQAHAPDAHVERPRNPTEIERKFLVDLSEVKEHIDLTAVQKRHLRQGYIAIGADGSETRVRSFDNERFELTTKSPGMVARDEQTVTLSREMFEALWHQTAGRLVVKTRYYIPLGKLTVELDVYEGRLEGLVTAEVEFGGRPQDAMIKANTFEPPVWFGRDISEDARYKNHSLAQHLPHNPIPIGSIPI